jgi:hypothetical protein
MVGMVIEDVTQNRVRIEEGKAGHLASQTFPHLIGDGLGKSLAFLVRRGRRGAAILLECSCRALGDACGWPNSDGIAVLDERDLVALPQAKLPTDFSRNGYLALAGEL